MTTYQQMHINHIWCKITTTGKAVIVFQFDIRDLGALPVAPDKALEHGAVTRHGFGIIGDASNSTSQLERLGYSLNGDAWINTNPTRKTQRDTFEAVGIRGASLRDRDEVAAAWIYLETWARRQDQVYILPSYMGWVLDQLFLVGAISTIEQFELERGLKEGLGLAATNKIRTLVEANEHKPITDFE